MKTTNLKSLIETAVPVSPDRKYSLAWSWKGRLGILTLKDGDPLLTFREEHGAILRAGFAPDMRRLIAENEDRSFSIWHMASRIGSEKFAEADNIVDFMINNELVPCLNIIPGVKACRFELTLHDFSCATIDCFDWENYYCDACAWRLQVWNPSPCRPPLLRCALRQGCEFRHKGT